MNNINILETLEYDIFLKLDIEIYQSFHLGLGTCCSISSAFFIQQIQAITSHMSVMRGNFSHKKNGGILKSNDLFIYLFIYFLTEV